MALFGRKGEKKPAPLTPFCTAVIAAAGSSARMAGEDKLLHKLADVPVLVRTLRVFESAGRVDEIIVVTREDKLESIAALMAEYGLKKVKKVIPGGKTRAESVLKGVEQADPQAQLIAVHDGARPFVTEKLIQTAIAQAERFNACVPFVPVVDTVKERDGQFVKKTLERKSLVAIQTPQVFNKDLLSAALLNAEKKGLAITDDASAVEALGAMVHLTEGSPENIKITTPLDLILAEAILKHREEA